MSVRGYQVAASWSGSPNFTGPLEDVSSYVTKDTAVVITWGRTDGWTASVAAAGKLTFELLNNGRQFSPENASSAIASRPRTGVPARVTDGGTTLFLGDIDTYEVTTSRSDRTFSAECSDGWVRPGGTQLSTPVYQGKRTGELIGIILDAAGWPAAARDIDAGATYVPYWWAEGIDAKTAIADLVSSEGLPAIAYITRGVFTFRDRHHRLTRSASLTSQGTYTQISPSGAVGADHKILKDTFTYADGVDHIVNVATIEVTPRLPGPETGVWSLTDPIALSANEVRQYIIQASDPFINAQLPSLTEVTVDGVLGADYTLDAGTVSFGLSRTSGQAAILTLTAGAGGASLNNGLRLRAIPLAAGAVQKFTSTDSVSVAKYGPSEWPGSAPWVNFYDAQAVADQVVANYSQPAPSVTFQVEGRLSTGTHARIVAAEISDRITVRNDEMGMTGTDFFVEQITHTIQQLGVRHIQTVAAQVTGPIQAANPFTFDVAGKGFDQGQFTAYAGNNPATMFRFDVSGQGFDQGVFAT